MTEKCQSLGCTRPAERQLGTLNLCATHFRHRVWGEFGEKLNPPWTKEQALAALINQDGMEPEAAAKRINEFSTSKKSVPEGRTILASTTLSVARCRPIHAPACR